MSTGILADDPVEKITSAAMVNGTATRTTYINGKKKVEKIKAAEQYDIAYVGDEEFNLEEIRN